MAHLEAGLCGCRQLLFSLAEKTRCIGAYGWEREANFPTSAPPGCRWLAILRDIKPMTMPTGRAEILRRWMWVGAQNSLGVGAWRGMLGAGRGREGAAGGATPGIASGRRSTARFGGRVESFCWDAGSVGDRAGSFGRSAGRERTCAGSVCDRAVGDGRTARGGCDRAESACARAEGGCDRARGGCRRAGNDGAAVVRTGIFYQLKVVGGNPAGMLWDAGMGPGVSLVPRLTPR